VITLVDQRLCEIERRHPGVLQKAVVEQHLVHARAGEGEAQIVGEPGAQVIGVEHRLRRLAADLEPWLIM